MSEKKKRRGAPSKDNPATERLFIRCTTEQREKWRREAEKADLTLSAWIKILADKNS